MAAMLFILTTLAAVNEAHEGRPAISSTRFKNIVKVRPYLCAIELLRIRLA